MPLTKKITIIIISSLSFLLLVNFGLNFWIQKQLPKIIIQNNKTPYDISYKKIKVDLFLASIYTYKVVMVTKQKLKKSAIKIGIYTKIESISITNFKIWS